MLMKFPIEYGSGGCVVEIFALNNVDCVAVNY